MNARATRGLVVVTALLVVLAGCRTRSTAINEGSLLHAGEIMAPGRHFDHVIVIVLENQTYARVAADPYFAGLAQRGAVFTDFRALFHPSYPNYLAMVSGRSFMTRGDRQVTVDFPCIADALTAHGLTWRNYAEGYRGAPGRCDLRAGIDRYARRHVPFLSFRSVQRAHCAGVVGADQLPTDASRHQLPAYAFYSPNLDHDGHDPVSNPRVGLRKATTWLRTFLDPLLGRPELSGTLVVLTFDESEDRAPENRIFTAFLGDMVRPGRIDGSYNHFNVLRTIEDNFGLQPMGEGDKRARPIGAAWK